MDRKSLIILLISAAVLAGWYLAHEQDFPAQAGTARPFQHRRSREYLNAPADRNDQIRGGRHKRARPGHN